MRICAIMNIFPYVQLVLTTFSNTLADISKAILTSPRPPSSLAAPLH